ncbi:RNA polymerase sigma factor [Aggregatilinea lenta]|uniref:RNA polymerase sigma factor n=1 Tax=Aggregatilinea lenta TaxID=913108 RepID=UPI0013C325A7|nr:sigma-70 family RNA polymerase sigma factor [Aggregatilinea lenta]
MHPPSDPDRALLNAIAQGDTHALEALYVQHGLRLLHYLVGQLGDPALAEEVLQDVMLAIWQQARRFRGESRVTTWMLAIARHHAISARRRQKAPPGILPDHAVSSAPPPLDTLIRRDECEAVREALHSLPDDQRETLELVFYHGLSGPEAARVLGVAHGTVKSRLHRAKASLQKLLSIEEKNDA